MSDINNIKPPVQGGLNAPRNASVEDKRTAETTANPVKTGGDAAMDKISLTATATQLQSLQQKIAALPAVDEQKVAALRAAIEDGSYQVDSQKLARNMIDFEGNL
jgi:negative regulator of flagellin synthesis FlgM